MSPPHRRLARVHKLEGRGRPAVDVVIPVSAEVGAGDFEIFKEKIFGMLHAHTLPTAPFDFCVANGHVFESLELQTRGAVVANQAVLDQNVLAFKEEERRTPSAARLGHRSPRLVVVL